EEQEYRPQSDEHQLHPLHQQLIGRHSLFPPWSGIRILMSRLNVPVLGLPINHKAEANHQFERWQAENPPYAGPARGVWRAWINSRRKKTHYLGSGFSVWRTREDSNLRPLGS